MSVVKRRLFPEAFKRQVVERVASSGLSAGAVAAELGLHETVLRRWMTQFGTQATGTSRRSIPQAASPSPSDLAAENARLRRENDRLRMERGFQKNRHHPRGGCEVRFGFIHAHRNVWPVRVMCDVLGMSASGYYAWRARPESGRVMANRDLLADIRRIHEESSSCYGHRVFMPSCADTAGGLDEPGSSV